MAKKPEIFTDFAVDVETLGRRYDAPIVAIGCVPFNPTTGRKSTDTFYREISLASAIKAGRVDPDTLSWWMTQSPDARRIFLNQEAKTPLSVALDEFRAWLGAMCTRPKIWGNGAVCDVAKLMWAYDHGAVGLVEPWVYKDVRDMRTITEAAGYSDDNWPFPRNAVTMHNALQDAHYQAEVIGACIKRIRDALAGVDPKKEAKTTKGAAEKSVEPDPYLAGIQARNESHVVIGGVKIHNEVDDDF